ncbi:hypothetical protein Tco_0922661 [Tanacetum coccineum]|uniref:Uncharacterized protein n=1 Tax=Tanacetum coccineum TaxID=301880 RepID=A0ABQ5D0A6_9ASTR
MSEMFGLLKELTTSRNPEKVLVREETRNPITKCINAISFVRTDKDMDIENVEVVNKNVVGISELTVVEPSRVVDKEKEVKDEMNNEPIRSVIENITDRQVKGVIFDEEKPGSS